MRNANIPECIRSWTDAGFIGFSVRIPQNKSILCGMLCNPRIVASCCIIIGGCPIRINHQIKRPCCMIIRISARQHRLFAFIIGSLFFPCPVSAHNHNIIVVIDIIICLHQLIKMVNDICIQRNFHITDTITTVSALIDCF